MMTSTRQAQFLAISVLTVAACTTDNGGGSAGTGAAGTGFAGTAVSGMGVAGTGASGTGLAGTGVSGTGAGGMGVSGMGASGTGASGTGAGGTGVSGIGASGTGVSGMGASGTGASGTGASGTGASGTGASGTGASGTGAAGTGGSSAGMVTVSFTTVSYGGQYAPFNYGAVWFETPTGEFIKTAERWAGTIHASDLATWTAASGGWGSIFGGGNMADMVDAVSSATKFSHEMHTVTWNMMDSTPALVPDGDYVCVIEMSEDRAATRHGPVVRIPFTKGPGGAMETAADQEGFSGVTLNYQP